MGGVLGKGAKVSPGAEAEEALALWREDALRLSRQLRFHAGVCVFIPVLVGILIVRVRSESASHYGDVVYGVEGTADDLTFCETYPCWDGLGALITQP